MAVMHDPMARQSAIVDASTSWPEGKPKPRKAGSSGGRPGVRTTRGGAEVKDLNDKLVRPTKDLTNGDIWHALTKATLGTIPIFGSTFSELFHLAIKTPAQKRMTQWEAAVGEVLNRLITTVDGLTAEQLAKNEDFLTTVIAATQIAMKTARTEKIKELQAIVYRSGSGVRLEEFIRNTFLQIVDRYVPEHVVLLKELSSEKSVKLASEKLRSSNPDKATSSLSEPESGEYCKVEDLVLHLEHSLDATITAQLFGDLHRDGLCYGSEGFALTYYNNHPPYIVTERGREFLKFVNTEDLG